MKQANVCLISTPKIRWRVKNKTMSQKWLVMHKSVGRMLIWTSYVIEQTRVAD